MCKPTAIEYVTELVFVNFGRKVKNGDILGEVIASNDKIQTVKQ